MNSRHRAARTAPRSRLPGALIWGLKAALPLALVAACAVSETPVSIGDGFLDAGSSAPSFTPSPEAGSADVSLPTAKMCIATECTAPYGTCAGGLRCTTNFSNDPNNCGACGEKCPSEFGYLNMTSSCVDGACEPACSSKAKREGDLFFLHKFADCNKALEDGCEVLLSTDPNNCGVCGNQCAPGVRCILGKCGCDSGQMDCNGRCVDVRSNDESCGACGNVCATPEDAGEPPPNMYYGCVEGQCGQPKCIDFYDIRWANCDNNLANGCEVYVGPDRTAIDPNNCGVCGNKCTAEQICADTNLDWVPECNCTQPNETLCGSPEDSSFGCHDLLNDVNSCGNCFNGCPVPGTQSNQTSACRKGVCEVECLPGWGDCDLEPSNGCETNLASTDAHCGACGSRCDTQAGQPCIEGQCAMTECDAGGPK